MIRRIDVILVLLVIVVVSATYVLKYGAEIEYAKVSKLNREIKIEQEATDILKANWSLLTDPRRIQDLTNRYNSQLQLELMQPEQVTNIDNIPLRRIEVPAQRNAQNQGVDVSGVITGAISKSKAHSKKIEGVSRGE